MCSALISATVVLAGATAQAASPSVGTWPIAARPGTTISVSGSDFSPTEAVDLYFDTTDISLAVTDDSGSFSTSLTIPMKASYAIHWITAVGRQSGLAAQVTFQVIRAGWPEFRHDAGHSGYLYNEVVLSRATVGGLGLDWSYTTGDAIEASPAVADGVAYVSSDDGNLYAFNASTGALLWSEPRGGFGGDFYPSSPAVAEGVVYVGSGDANLYALSASSGTVLWSFPTGGTLYSSPVVSGGVVYTAPQGGSLYALDAGSGKELWARDTGENDSSPAVANGVVYIGGFHGRVHALRASTGAELWSARIGGEVDSSPSVVNGVVYVGSSDRRLYALRASNGA